MLGPVCVLTQDILVKDTAAALFHMNNNHPLLREELINQKQFCVTYTMILLIQIWFVPEAREQYRFAICPLKAKFVLKMNNANN